MRRRDPRHHLGRRGERAAAVYLRRQRYRVLKRNYSCTFGEIDLVCSDGDTLVFTEVKTRSSDEAEVIANTFRKPQWRRVERAAQCFRREFRVGDRPCRFDLVTVLWHQGAQPHIEHFEDVFQSRRH